MPTKIKHFVLTRRLAGFFVLGLANINLFTVEFPKIGKFDEKTFLHISSRTNNLER